MLTSDKIDLLDRYRSLREKQKALHHELLRKYLSKNAVVKSAKRLGLYYKNDDLMLGSEEELNILMDYCLYDHREIAFAGQSQNAFEKRLQRDPPPRGSDELEILKAATKARYTLLRVESVESGLGVNVIDAFAQKRFLLMDVGFGSSASPEMVLAARIVAPFGIHMTTGAGLPIDSRSALKIRAELVPLLREKTNADFARMTPSEKAQVSATIIRASLKSGASEYIRYAE